MGAPSRAGRPSLSGGCNSLKMRYRKGGGAREEARDGARKRNSSRRDEQVSAEKWVSRTRVSAGEYHIATL